MPEVNKKIVISFPGQGGRDYKGPLSPEVALYRESLGNYQAMVGIFPGLENSNSHWFGYSFGLYTAGAAAGVFTQDEGEVLITTRSELIKKDEDRRIAEGKSPTGMVLIFGQKIDEIRALVGRKSESYRAILAKSGLIPPQDLHHTNINGDISHVVSGDYQFLQAAVDFFGERSARLLPIRGMYHEESRKRVSEEYAKVIDDDLGIEFKNPSKPVISSTPRLLETGAEVKKELIDQIHTNVDTIGVVKLMEMLGIGVVIDPGPGQFANQALRRINRGLTVISYDVQAKPSITLDNAMDAVRQLLSNLGK